MPKKVATLTPQFNEVTIKKGQVFRIQTTPVGGGFVGEYEEFKVVQGRAEKVEDPSAAHPHYGDEQFVRFKAVEKGDIEITAEKKAFYDVGGSSNVKKTYKIYVV